MGDGGNGEMLVKGYQLLVVRLMLSGDLMYSMVTLVNDTRNMYVCTCVFDSC